VEVPKKLHAHPSKQGEASRSTFYNEERKKCVTIRKRGGPKKGDNWLEREAIIELTVPQFKA
jgi:hypothetical protein